MAHELTRALTEVARLRALLAAGAHRDQLGAALVQGAAGNHLEAVEVLLEHGAQVNAAWAFGRTALFYSSRLEMIDLLISRGADVTIEASGEDVLEHFLGQRRSGAKLPENAIEYVRRFLDAGLSKRLAARGRSYLTRACACGVPAIVELLLHLGVEPKPNDSLFKDMRYVEHRAEAFSSLVKAGVDPNLRDAETTLLTEVCREGAIDLAMALLDAGAEVNPPIRATPLAVAQEKRNQVLVDLLLERGARVPGPSFDLETTVALERAEQQAKERPMDGAIRLEWARVLLRHGFRAAAAAEWFAAGRLGASDESLTRGLAFDNGTRWSFLPFEPAFEGVAGRVDDARMPGARVSDGLRTLPLALVLGPPCSACDERGEQVCALCDGRGSYGSQFSDDDVECPPRQSCPSCGGLKYVVASERAGLGACQHAFVPEWRTANHRLERCRQCGLASFFFPGPHGLWKQLVACGSCGRFRCRCGNAS